MIQQIRRKDHEMGESLKTRQSERLKALWFRTLTLRELQEQKVSVLMEDDPVTKCRLKRLMI